MFRKRSVITFACLAVVGVMVGGAVWAARQLPNIRLQNDIETWLAEDDEQAEALKRMEAYFPKEERIVVSWDSSDLADPRMAELRDRLTNVKFVSKVRTAADLVQQMTQWKVDHKEAVVRLTGVLIGRIDKNTDSSPTQAVDQCPNVSAVVTLSSAGQADPAAAIEAIRMAALESGVPESELHVGGEVLTSLAVDREVWTATWNSVDPLQRPPVFAISALSGILLAVFVLRSVRVGLLVTVAAWFTALTTTALFPATGHTMNMVTIVMPTLLVVLTVSAAIHVVNYWRRAASTGTESPLREAVKIGWRPCLLATATTGAGLSSLAISRLGPIRDFGVFSTIGTVLSFVVAVFAIPAMLRLFRIPPGSIRSEHAVWRRIALKVCRHRKAITAGWIVAGLAAACGLQWLQTEVKVGRYFPDDSQLIQDSRFFEQNVGGISSVDVLVHFGADDADRKLFLDRLELIREIENTLRQHPNVSGAISLADFQPKLARPAADAERSVRMKDVLRSRRTESKIKNGERAASAEYLSVPLPSDDEWTLSDPVDETWRITVQTLLSDDLDYGVLAQQLSSIVEDRLTATTETWFDVTGSVPVFYRAQAALLNSLMRSFGLALFVIAVAMMVLLQSVPAGLMSSLPGILPIAVVFGLMSWRGYVLDIGTMLTGSAAMGIAVDDMLHLLTWFRESIRQGDSREEAVVHALRHCGAAMTQTTLVIALSLLLLFPADLLLISRFGWVMAALLGVAWLSSVMLLPALLAGPLGRMIEKGCVGEARQSKVQWPLTVPP